MIDFEDFNYKMTHSTEEQLIDEIKIDIDNLRLDIKEQYTKEQIDELLKKQGIEVENKGGYDYMYVAQSTKNDYLGGSVPNEQYLAMHIREVCDDADAPDGYIFKSWCLRMDMLGEPVDWEDYL